MDGHASTFAFLGGVLQNIPYENTGMAVARTLGDARPRRARTLSELQSHYLFGERFGRPGRGNDKVKMEGYVRHNFPAPIPRVESFAALNDYLVRDLDALPPLPTAP